MSHAWTCAVCLTALAVVSGACRTAPPPAIDRFDVELRIAANGSVEVAETETARFSGGGDGQFDRRVVLDQADDVLFTSASIDGREVSTAAGDTRVIVDQRNRVLDVRWIFPPSLNATHVFGLRYVAAGAIDVEGTHGSVSLGVIPSRRASPIASSRISFVAGDGLGLLEESGIAEAGWNATRIPNGIAAERRDLAASEGATVIAALALRAGSLADPRWRINQEWSRELIPAFVSGGLFILIIGAGILGIIRFQYGRSTVDAAERPVVRRGLRNGGLMSIGVAVVSAVVLLPMLDRVGVWSMAVPASILIVGIVLATLARRIV